MTVMATLMMDGPERFIFVSSSANVAQRTMGGIFRVVNEHLICLISLFSPVSVILISCRPFPLIFSPLVSQNRTRSWDSSLMRWDF